MNRTQRTAILSIVILASFVVMGIVSRWKEPEPRILAAELIWIIVTAAPQTPIAVAPVSIRSDLTLVEFFAGY